MYLNNARLYTPVLRGISLPEGDYSYLRVYLKGQGKLYYNNEIYPVHLAKRFMTYTKKFSIEKGKITTLSLFSIRDKIKDILDRHIKREFCIYKSHNWHLYKKNKKKLNLTLRLFLPFDDGYMILYHKFISE